MREIIVNADEKTKNLGNIFGLFFEDINHAADGGIYAELVQNRSYEYCEIDNPQYHGLTSWVKSSNLKWEVKNQGGVNESNPHHLVVEGSDGDYFYNEGFGSGMHFVAGENYRATLRLKTITKSARINLYLGSVSGEDTSAVSEVAEVRVSNKDWDTIELVLTANKTIDGGIFVIAIASDLVIDFDTISLFPENTYKNRKNGLRSDLVEALKVMHPKFLRFPGGCLTHDGSLDDKARNSMYRWKNTIGTEYDRPSKRNNWGYNQTLGLGYYEYFLLCEDLETEPLPVVPAGFNPHKGEGCSLEEVDTWVKETLDLIDFANGDENTEWGKRRIELGHEKPFNMKYLAIGNEEVGDGFFERYPYFHKAIKEYAPYITIINSAGPFASGESYEAGWNSAKKHGSDLVDEHYYSNPDWYLANMHHYDNFSAEGPGVFLGEYASWGNTLYNAIIEAAYMTHLEKAPAVKLACYAPLFCNVSYKNWTPDMIFFNESEMVLTPNYYVQKLFMENQGESELSIKCVGFEEPITLFENDGLFGDICISGNDIKGTITNLTVTNSETNQILSSVDQIDVSDSSEHTIINTGLKKYSLEFEFDRHQGRKGLNIKLGKNNNNYVLWEFGGWDNWDCNLQYVRQDKGATISQHVFHVEDIYYNLKVEVDGLNVKTFINGQLWNDARIPQPEVEDLYVCASKDGDEKLYLKIVNLTEEVKPVKYRINSKNEFCLTSITELSGNANAENSFENPNNITPVQRMVNSEASSLEIKGNSLSVLCFTKNTH